MGKVKNVVCPKCGENYDWKKYATLADKIKSLNESHIKSLVIERLGSEIACLLVREVHAHKLSTTSDRKHFWDSLLGRIDIEKLVDDTIKEELEV